MAMNVHYRLITARGLGGIAWPLAICAGAFAALPLFSGLPLPSLSRAAAKPVPTPGVERFAQEVYVPNVARGCRWQYSSQADVQIADCGDDGETIRVVFERGRVTEYRVIARQDPSKPPPAPVSAASLQPSQPGRSIPNQNQAPLRVTGGSGG
jgi:hypothetical protein